MKTYNEWRKIWKRGNAMFSILQDDIDEMSYEEGKIEAVGKYIDAYYEFMAASNKLHDWYTKLPF